MCDHGCRTRGCRFCAINKRDPAPLDRDEPERVKEAVELLALKHVVVTSPTRDDIADGGAGHFSAVVDALKGITPYIKVEVLVPDFAGNLSAWHTLSVSRADVIAHNIETVPSLYGKVRCGAFYDRSLGLLRYMKEADSSRLVKSGLMLGLGETRTQLNRAIADIKSTGVDILTVGQYLAPSKAHYPVQEYVSPEVFEDVKSAAYKMGFKHVESGPYVRSSYLAGNY